jgi:hypothetical protein
MTEEEDSRRSVTLYIITAFVITFGVVAALVPLDRVFFRRRRRACL